MALRWDQHVPGGAPGRAPVASDSQAGCADRGCDEGRSRRGDIVLDLFGGSGTTLLSAERVGRRAYTLEIESRFVDVAIRRWQTFSGKDGICAETGLSFDEIACTRVVPSAAGSVPAHVAEEGASDRSERFRDSG